jgi:hypothetical protein
MAGEVKVEEWWVTVQTERRGPYRDRESAYAVARALKQINPRRHVAVVDPTENSEEVG